MSLLTGNFAFSSPCQFLKTTLHLSAESGDYKRQVSNESLKDPQVQALSQQLKEWINDVLTDDHIVVKNLCEDLSDGQVLSALIGENST